MMLKKEKEKKKESRKSKAVYVPQLNSRTELNDSFNFGRNRIEAGHFMDFGGVFLQTTFSP